MRIVVIYLSFIFTILNYNFTIAQSSYHGAFENHFFGWSPSARMEALGKGFVSIEGDPYSYYTNPGAMGTVKGLNLTAGFSNPYYSLGDASYNYFSASYNHPLIGTIGISRDYSDLGEISFYNPYNGDLISYMPFSENYRITYAKEFIKGFYSGINLNYFRYNYNDGIPPLDDLEKGSTFMTDFGVLKRFDILPKGEILLNVDLGASIFNFTRSEVNDQSLPVIFRIGGSYNMGLLLPNTPWDTRFLNILYTLEYQDVLNAGYLNGVKTGLEFTFFELISLRGGFYSLKSTDQLSSCSNCKPRVEEFTYGVGINLPLKNLNITKIPATFKFDISVLPQPSLITNPEDFNFSDYRVFNFTASVPF